MRRLLLLLLTASSMLLSVLTGLPAEAATTSAKSLLSKLTVRAESGSSSYVRAKFRAWIDADGDSCDTREEVLLAESRVTTRRGAGCRVMSGRWYSPYDGRTWTNPSDVDIDHVIPLKEAWESGARSWSPDTRKRFANDLSFGWSLDAMTDNLNSSKQARDPAGWLPPRAKCRYVTHWIAVKYRWRLTIDRAEKAKAAAILAGTCGTKPVTVPSRASVAVASSTPTTPPQSSGTDPRFDWCYQANAAGYGPYYRGADPEYEWYQDRDNDGIVCER